MIQYAVLACSARKQTQNFHGYLTEAFPSATDRIQTEPCVMEFFIVLIKMQNLLFLLVIVDSIDEMHFILNLLNYDDKQQ